MGREQRCLSDCRARARLLLEKITDRALSYLSSDRRLGHVRRDEQPAIERRAHRRRRADAIHLKNSSCSVVCRLRSPREEFMWQHRSVKGASTLAAKRNVLQRFERGELLQKRGQGKEGGKVGRHPKTKPDL